MSTESQPRGGDIGTAILKTITYRVFGSLVSFGIGYGYAGWDAGVAFGLTDFFLKPVLYFIHERAWQYVGRPRPERKS